MNGRILWMVAVLAMTASGCRGTAVVAGNLTSMGIVILMLWSTLQIERD